MGQTQRVIAGLAALHELVAVGVPISAPLASQCATWTTADVETVQITVGSDKVYDGAEQRKQALGRREGPRAASTRAGTDQKTSALRRHMGTQSCIHLRKRSLSQESGLCERPAKLGAASPQTRKHARFQRSWYQWASCHPSSGSC